jgi:hypothetical protein
MSNLKKNKDFYIFIGSLICLIYFSFLFINTYILKSENVIIGFIQELFTLPLLLGTIVLLIFSIKFSISRKFSLKSYAVWSFIILVLLITVTFGSFL